MMTLIFNIDMVQEKLSMIEEAIVLSKLGIVSKGILGEKEIDFVMDKLSKQGIQLEMKDQIYNFIDVLITNDNDIFMYVVIVPQVHERWYRRLMIQPSVVNGTRMKMEKKVVLLAGEELFEIQKPCSSVEKYEICPIGNLKNISDDDCFKPLTLGIDGKCDFIEAKQTQIVNLWKPGVLVIESDNQTMKLQNDCGLGNRTLRGKFVVLFENCSIEIDGQKYEQREVEILEKPWVMPLDGLNVTKTSLEPKLGPIEIKHLHMKNLKKIERLSLRQQTSTVMSFGLWTILGIVVMIFVFRWIWSKKPEAMNPFIMINNRSTQNRGDSSPMDGQVMFPATFPPTS